MSNNSNSTNNKTTNTTTSNSDSLDKIMAELSNKYNTQAVQIVQAANQVQTNRDLASGNQTKQVGPIKLVDSDIARSVQNSIESALSQGSKEFEQKAGRPMTYSEMRAMWG
jgi:hypothetical protein